MAEKIFTANELRARVRNSGKVDEVLHKIMGSLVDRADNGGSSTTLPIDRDIVDAITRKLAALGFKSEYNANYGKISVAWLDDADTVEDKKPVERKTNVSDKPALEKKAPAKCEVTEAKTTQTCDEIKTADEVTDTKCEAKTETAKTIGDDKRGKGNVNIMRSVVFEGCTFNVSIPVDINVPIDVHHFSVKQTRNVK